MRFAMNSARSLVVSYVNGILIMGGVFCVYGVLLVNNSDRRSASDLRTLPVPVLCIDSSKACVKNSW